MTDAPKPAPKLLPPKKESPTMSIVSNTLAIVGFIILLVIIVWGLLHIVNISKFSFGSLFASPATIEITAPKSPVSGNPVTISWKLNNETKAGSFSFVYQCEPNFAFVMPGQNGAMNKIPCGTSITVGSSTSATMIPMAATIGAVSVPFSVVFTPTDGSARVEASASMSVAPAAQVAQPAPAQPAASKPAAPAKKPVTSYHAVPSSHYAPVAHAASGPADLKVTIIATGYIDPSGALLMNRAPTPGDLVGVEFDIANVGGSPTGTWFFQAHLPTSSAYTYTSANQVSLAPGDHIVNTLRFTMLTPGGGMFTAVADPSNLINDINRTNNEAAVMIY